MPMTPMPMHHQNSHLTSHTIVLQRLKRICLTVLTLLAAMAPSFAAAEFDHGNWDELLRRHVVPIDGGVATQVDYAGFKASSVALEEYLQSLSAVSKSEFDSWTLNHQLAFLINAYNAWTISLILTEYPELDSIKDIGGLFRSPWKRNFVSLFGDSVSLDDIEHGMIRGWGRYLEPRIHFAVNCAAIGCPALRNEAYVAQRLQQQLDDSTRKFLADRKRNYYENNRLWVSSIFNWYEEDFEKGWQGIESVGEFLSNYAVELSLPSAVERALANDDQRIRYLRYDWKLNRVPDP